MKENQGGPINWQHYNYPPLIRLVHYSTDQLKQPFLGLAKKMHACAILIVINQLINLLNCIIESAVDCPQIKNIIVLYSILNVAILSFAAMFSFSNGYYALCQGPSHPRRLWVYRISQVILCICWFVFSIVGGNSPFDGWAKFKQLSQCNLGFSIFLGVVQNLIYLVVCGMGVYNLVVMRRLYGEDPFIRDGEQAQAVANTAGEEQQEEKGGFGGMFKKIGRANRDKSDDEI